MSAANPIQKLNVLLFTLMLKELQHGHCSASDLVPIVGLRRVTLRGYLQTMHKHGVLRIVDYETDSCGRQRMPIYAMGAGKDVPRKAPNTNTESSRRYQSRLSVRALERWAA